MKIKIAIVALLMLTTTMADAFEFDLSLWHSSQKNYLSMSAPLTSSVYPGTFTRASTQYEQDATGTWNKYLTNVPAFGASGYSSTPAVTNKVTAYGVPRADALGSELMVQPDMASLTGLVNNGGLSSPFEIVPWQGAANTLHIKGDSTYAGNNSGSILTKGKIYAITARVWVVSGSLKIGEYPAAVTISTLGSWVNISIPNYIPTGLGFSQYLGGAGSEAYIDTISAKEAIDYVGTKAYHNGTAFQNPITGMTLSGDTAAVLSIVADQTAVEAAKLTTFTNGYKVYDVTTGVGGAGVVTFTGSIAAVQTSIGIRARVLSGSVVLSDSTGANDVALSGTTYARFAKENFLGTAARTVILTVAANSQVRFIIPTLVDSAYLPSPVPSAGAATTLAATTLSYPITGNLPTSGTRHIQFNWKPAGYAVGTTQYLWSSYVDANNYTAIWYNGVIVTMEKKIAGVSEYVTSPLTATVGTAYTIDGYINSDNTLQLKVNGDAANSGLGSELVTNGNISGTTGWTAVDGTMGDVDGVLSGTATYFYQNLTYNRGRLYELNYIGSGNVKGIVFQAVGAVSYLSSSRGTVSGSYYDYPNLAFNYKYTFVANTSVAIQTKFYGNGADHGIDNITAKEVYNNSTTAAPQIGSTMQIGSQNGDSQAFGEIYNFKVLGR